MTHLLDIKHKLYSKQTNYLYGLFVLIALLTTLFANNPLLALVHHTLFMLLIYFGSKQLLVNKQVGFISLLISSCMPIVFAPLVGKDSLLWLFNIILVFQVIFLLPTNYKQIIGLAFILSSVFISSYLQQAELAAILSRVLLALSISVFSWYTVTSLLRSQKALFSEVQERKVLNNELEAVKTFQRQILDSTNYAVIAFDLEGTIIEFNQGAVNLLNYKPEEVLGKATPLLFYTQPELIKRTNDINTKYHANIAIGIHTLTYKNKIGLTNTSEWTYVTKHGEKKSVLVSTSNLKDHYGRITGFVLVANDISSKKVSEEKQQTAETIIANSPTVLIKWLPDEKWTVLYVSPNVFKILGYTSYELTSGSVQYVNLMFEDDLAEVITQTQLALKEDVETLHFEYRIKRKDETVIWVEEQTHLKRRPNGEIEFYEGILTDITQRKKAELELKNSELVYQLAIQGISAGIWDWIDINFDEEWWSPKFYELLGYKDREIKASLSVFKTLLHPDDVERTMLALDLHFNHHQPFKIEYRIKNKNGMYHWYLGSGQAYFDKNQKPVRMIGSIIRIEPSEQTLNQIKLDTSVSTKA